MQIEYKETADGRKSHTEVGELGIVFKTEMIHNLEKGESKLMGTTIQTEVRASYYTVRQELIHVEMWDFNGWGLNRFLGIRSVPIMDIVSGSILRNMDILGKDKKDRGKLSSALNVSEFVVAQVSFKVVFQEIWDFYLTFNDFKAGNLQKESEKTLPINPQLQLELFGDNYSATTSSPKLNNDM